jgi:hypothetical protein
LKPAWLTNINDSNITRSDLPLLAPHKKTIMDGFAADPSFQAALTKGKADAWNVVKAKIPTWWTSPPLYKPLLPGDGTKGVTDAGSLRTEYLRAASSPVVDAAKQYADTKTTVGPQVKAVAQAIRFEENGPTGKIEFQPWNLENHTLYKPQNMKATILPDGSTRLEYTGYRNTQFAVTISKDGLKHTIEGKNLSEKIPAVGLARGAVPATPPGAPPSTAAPSPASPGRGQTDPTPNEGTSRHLELSGESARPCPERRGHRGDGESARDNCGAGLRRSIRHRQRRIPTPERRADKRQRELGASEPVAPHRRSVHGLGLRCREEHDHDE